jgi:hypothetical protein
MQNPITRFQYWFQSDPNAAKKTMLIVGSIVVFMLLGGLFLSSFRSAVKPTATGNGGIAEVPRDIPNGGFGNIERVDVASPAPVGSKESVNLETGKLIFTSPDYKLTVDSAVVDSSQQLVTTRIIADADQLLLRDELGDYVYNSKVLSTLPRTITSPVPATITDDFGLSGSKQYYYIEKKTDSSPSKVVIKSTSTVFSELNTPEVATLLPTIKVTWSELVSIKGQPYAILYAGDTYKRAGNIEIWRIVENKPERIFELKDVLQLKTGPQQMMYTTKLAVPTDLTLYENHVINFASNSKGEDERVDIALYLAQKNVFGSVLAERCDFHPTDPVVYCLVKTKKVDWIRSDAKDEIVKFNYSNDNLELPYSSMAISASAIILSPRGEVYFVGQTDRLLYKIS